MRQPGAAPDAEMKFERRGSYYELVAYDPVGVSPAPFRQTATLWRGNPNIPYVYHGANPNKDIYPFVQPLLAVGRCPGS